MTEMSQQDQPRKIPKPLTSPFRQQYKRQREEAGKTLIESGISPTLKDLERKQVLSEQEQQRLKQAKKIFEKARQNFAKRLTTKEIEGEVDVLTGLLNRRGFNRRIEDIVGAMKRKGTNVFALMLDVNDLKKINDEDKTHGKGDELIRKAALCMSNEVRATDVVVRWGGDEFLILLVDTNNMGGVLDFWERLNDSFIKNGVKISAGASQLDRTDVEGSVGKADKRMYLAKAESKAIGKNMITTSD